MSSTIDTKRLSESAHDFIDEPRLDGLLARKTTPQELDDVIAKSMAKQALTLEETAVLLAADDPAGCERIFDAARQLKRDVYGNRIVLFAPIYVGNDCVNDCVYCAFRRSNRAEPRLRTPCKAAAVSAGVSSASKSPTDIRSISSRLNPVNSQYASLTSSKRPSASMR